jgi:hypothetical protein
VTTCQQIGERCHAERYAQEREDPEGDSRGDTPAPTVERILHVALVERDGSVF